MLKLLENPRRRHHRRHHKRARHNPANPMMHRRRHTTHRRHRRNPFGVNKVSEQALGVGVEEMAAGAAAFVATEVLGHKIDTSMNKDYTAVPAQGTFDPMYVLRKTAPRALVAFGLHMLLKQAGMSSRVKDAANLGAGIAVASQAAAATKLFPADVLQVGSLQVGQPAGIRPMGGAMPLLSAPAAAAAMTPTPSSPPITVGKP